MKKINLLYLAAIPLIFGWIQMANNVQNTSGLFFGFAENKETELRYAQPVLIETIRVTPGQEVKKGDVLIEARQAKIDLQIQNVNHDLERLILMAKQKKQSLRDQINQIEAQKIAKTSALKAEIGILEKTIERQVELYKDLNTINYDSKTSKTTPDQIRLASLRQQLKLDSKSFNLEIKGLQNELALIQAPSEVEKEKLINEKNYYQEGRTNLKILAPFDGLVGNIHCKVGENIPAFTGLINFYEQNPTIVKGFVHESLIPSVQKYDSLEVSSNLHPQQPIIGQVIGLGARIVEIPERLRKVPEVKTYGREVVIQIPEDNHFLLREAVMLNTMERETNGPLSSLIAFFQSKKQPSAPTH